MRVTEIMSMDPVTVAPDHKVGDAVRIMDELHIRHLPVVEDGKLVGILSDRDLRSHRPPSEMVVRDLGLAVDLFDRPVSDILQDEVVTADPHAPLQKAVDLILEHRIGSLCIVDEHRALLGIVSTLDLLRVLRPAD